MFELNFLWIGLVEIFSHFVQGCTGFGATVIQAPVATGLLGTAEGVPFGTLITMPMLYVLGIKAFKQVSWKDLAKIVILMAPGVLVGHRRQGLHRLYRHLHRAARRPAEIRL